MNWRRSIAMFASEGAKYLFVISDVGELWNTNNIKSALLIRTSKGFKHRSEGSADTQESITSSFMFTA